LVQKRDGNLGEFDKQKFDEGNNKCMRFGMNEREEILLRRNQSELFE
jgi:hypothetical protein